MKTLRLGKNDFGLRVFCSKCKRNYSNVSLKKCTHPAAQKYKVIVYLNSRDTKVKTLDTRDYSEASKLAISFKDTARNTSNNENPIKHIETSSCISYFADLYLDFRLGLGVPEIRHRKITEKYFNSIKQELTSFLKFLATHNINPNVEGMQSINDQVVMSWYDMIRTQYAVGSLKTKICLMRDWIKWTIEEHEIKIKNPFRGTKIPTSNKPVEAISTEEFMSIIKEVRKGKILSNFSKTDKPRMKNIHRDYLENAFKLAILTGLRKEELIQLKWSNIQKVKECDAWVILSTNYKVENQQQKAYKPKVIPVTDELMKLLHKIGWEENILSDRFVIHPERIYSDASMRNDITKSFQHYYRLAFPDSPTKPFKSLRRTYITKMNNLLGAELIEFTSHSGYGVVKNHYIDPTLISKALDLRILNDENPTNPPD